MAAEGLGKSEAGSALNVQVGGDHYKQRKIQPVEYIVANDIGFLPGNVIKRMTRFDKPTGKGRQDLEKAMHEIQLLLELTDWGDQGFRPNPPAPGS